MSVHAVSGKRKIVTVLAVVAIAVVATYLYMQKQAAEDADPYFEYKAAMMRDEVGGQTPEETLDMFVAALRANDADRAAELFMLDDNLSRETWVVRLNEYKKANLFQKLADDIERDAKPGVPTYENDYGYVLYNTDGSVGADIDMEFNIFSGVWKLQSF